MGEDYLPGSFAEFDEWQKNLISKVVAGASTWNIPDARVTALTGRQQQWKDDYEAGGKQTDRRHSDTIAMQSTHKLYEKEIRDFVQEFLAKNSLVSNKQRAAMKLTVPDTEPTDRVAIEDRPTVRAEMKGGALLKLEFRVKADSSRPSMHPDADVVELKYQIGGTEPASPDETNKTETFSKAKQSMQLKVGNAGKFFYGFARWRNNSDVSKSGPYSVLIKIIISN